LRVKLEKGGIDSVVRVSLNDRTKMAELFVPGKKYVLVPVKELGITYQHATPQSVADCWQFWNCENIPNELPEYITEFKGNPIDYIGFGLSEETAKELNKEIK